MLPRALLSVSALSRQDVLDLLRSVGPSDSGTLPRRFWLARRRALLGQIMATVFLQPSLRTRGSFTSAFLRLGGNCITFSSLEGTLAPGRASESPAEIGRFLSEYADILVVRGGDARVVEDIAAAATIPVISAGHGVEEHPTSALNHLHTIWSERGTLEHLRVVAFARLPKRCLNSLLRGLLLFEGQHVEIVSPTAPALDALRALAHPTGSSVRWIHSSEEWMDTSTPENTDVIICDEGARDYEEHDDAVVTLSEEILSERFPVNVTLLHLKPLLKMFDAPLAARMKPVLARQSGKAMAIRAEIMRLMLPAGASDHVE